MILNLKEHFKVNRVTKKCLNNYVKRLVFYSISISKVSVVDLYYDKQNRVNWDLELLDVLTQIFKRA